MNPIVLVLPILLAFSGISIHAMDFGQVPADVYKTWQKGDLKGAKKLTKKHGCKGFVKAGCIAMFNDELEAVAYEKTSLEFQRWMQSNVKGYKVPEAKFIMDATRHYDGDTWQPAKFWDFYQSGGPVDLTTTYAYPQVDCSDPRLVITDTMASYTEEQRQIMMSQSCTVPQMVENYYITLLQPWQKPDGEMRAPPENDAQLVAFLTQSNLLILAAESGCTVDSCPDSLRKQATASANERLEAARLQAVNLPLHKELSQEEIIAITNEVKKQGMFQLGAVVAGAGFSMFGKTEADKEMGNQMIEQATMSNAPVNVTVLPALSSIASADACDAVEQLDTTALVEQIAGQRSSGSADIGQVNQEVLSQYTNASILVKLSESCLASALELKDLSRELDKERQILAGGTSMGKKEIQRQRTLTDDVNKALAERESAMSEMSDEQRKDFGSGVGAFVAGSYTSYQIAQSLEEYKASFSNQNSAAQNTGNAMLALQSIDQYGTDILSHVGDLTKTAGMLMKFSKSNKVSVPEDATAQFSALSSWD